LIRVSNLLGFSLMLCLVISGDIKKVSASENVEEREEESIQKSKEDLKKSGIEIDDKNVREVYSMAGENYKSKFEDIKSSTSNSIYARGEKMRERLKALGIDTDKAGASLKWLYILFFFSSFAFLYLFMHAVTCGGILSKEIEDIIKRICVAILLSSAILSFYCFSLRKSFLYLLPLAATPLILPHLFKQLNMAYRKKYAQPASEDCWICKTCARENHNILQECPECKIPKA